MLTTILMSAALMASPAPDLVAEMRSCKEALERPRISRVEIQQDCTRALNLALTSEYSSEETVRLLAGIVWDSRPGELYDRIEKTQDDN